MLLSVMNVQRKYSALTDNTLHLLPYLQKQRIQRRGGKRREITIMSVVCSSLLHLLPYLLTHQRFIVHILQYVIVYNVNNLIKNL